MNMFGDDDSDDDDSSEGSESSWLIGGLYSCYHLTQIN